MTTVQKIDKMPWDNAFGKESNKESNVENGINQKQNIAVNVNKMVDFAKEIEEQEALYGNGKPYRNIIRGKFIRD